MKTTLLAALISTMAIPAFANPGADMFARTLGLQPGEYTMAEMINIEEARRENDDEAERFYLSIGIQSGPLIGVQKDPSGGT